MGAVVTGGWIKIHRSILEHPVFADDGVFRLWTYLLFKANWEPKSWVVPGTFTRIEVGRGQLVVGGKSLHAAIFPQYDGMGKKIKRDKNSTVSERTLWRWMKALEQWDCIKIENVSNRCSMITICNYNTYQDVNQEPVTPVSNQRHAGVTPVSDQCLTGVRPVTTTKESKKSIKEESKKGRTQEPAAPLAFDSDSFSAAWTMFTAHRTAIKKPMTEEAIRLAQKKLATMGEISAILALETSVANGWQGIFEPKESRSGPNKFPSRTEQTLSAAQKYAARKEQENGQTDTGPATADCLPDGFGDCV